MTTFVLTLDLSGDHEHPENQRAQHALVCHLLDLAKQAIGSDIKRRGDIVHGQAFAHKIIGSWEFTADRKDIAA